MGVPAVTFIVKAVRTYLQNGKDIRACVYTNLLFYKNKLHALAIIVPFFNLVQAVTSKMLSDISTTLRITAVRSVEVIQPSQGMMSALGS